MDYNHLINNAIIAFGNAKDDRFKEYWLDVIEKLLQNAEKSKVLH
jgi:hypothetical protein